MILTIQIEVDETQYKEAIVEGWYDRFGEAIDVDEVKTMDNFDDFRNALPHIIIDNDAVQISIMR